MYQNLAQEEVEWRYFHAFNFTDLNLSFSIL